MDIDYLASARRIAEALLVGAQERDDGSLTWGRGAGRQREPVADSGPFNGRCGEALLLAALHAATGDAAYEQAASRALLGLDRVLQDEAACARLADHIVDGLAGVAGIVYTLVRVRDFLQRDELVDRAARLARAVTPAAIARDEKLDIIWGAAGVILAMLALADAGAGEDEALARAEQCAAHLLARRTADPDTGLRGWATLRQVPSTGFAHGCSGIAYALLRLYQRTGAAEYYDAAVEAFAFERALYLAEHGNWLDSRVEPEGIPVMWSWCHGAPGIALSRLGALDCLRDEDDESAVAQDLMTALRATAVARVPGVDPICCGHFGRIDILLEAGRRLGNASLVRQARHIAHARLQRAQEQGFLLSPVEVDVEPHLHPGFWQGTAGIGYTLLRLADPDAYPCVLAMA